jgi:SecD/SecF fusion protein
MRPRAPVGLIALSAIALSGCGGATHSGQATTTTATHARSGVDLLYAVAATSTSPDSSATRTRTAATLRARLQGLAPGATVRIDPHDRISVFLPGVSPGAPLTLEVGAAGALEFYDWEANVIGPGGRPAPTDATVTGGANPGGASDGITLYEAVIRASRRPQVSRPADLPLGNGSDGSWYLVDRRAQTVLAGPAAAEAALAGRHAALTGSAVVRVEPGTVIVAAESPNDQPDPTIGRYYVLNDAPALGNADITDPREAPEPQPGGTGQPSVTFGFTAAGRSAFRALTKVIARRGARLSTHGQTDLQHFAIVLDDRLISVPGIDFSQYPDGIDASDGSEISGGFAVTSAKLLARTLQGGSLPIELTLLSARPSAG